MKDAQTASAAEADVASMLRLARAARLAGDLASAINLYRNALLHDPENSGLQVKLGDVLAQAGSFDDAIGVFEAVDSASADKAAALVGLSRIYLQLNQPEQALAYAHQAQQIAPADAQALNQHGVSLDSLSRHDEAQACYRAILETAPRHVPARNNLALSLALSGHLDEAAAILTPMARSSDASPQIRQNLALIYGLKGDTQRAAILSKMDLDDEKVQANLEFFDYARSPQR